MRTKKIVELSFLVAVAIVLQILESMIPIVWIVPGFKVGFANIAGLFALMKYDSKSMVLVNLLRVFLACLLQGTLFSVSFWLSISGQILSMCAMILAKKSGKFSIFGISVCGASFHSIGQVLMITWIYQQYFMQAFLPILLALSIVSGLCIGYISQLTLNRLEKTI